MSGNNNTTINMKHSSGGTKGNESTKDLSCLLELTEVELALLTPAKVYGYCASWKGHVEGNKATTTDTTKSKSLSFNNKTN